MSATSRPGGGETRAAPRYFSTSTPMASARAGYQVPAIGEVRTGPAMKNHRLASGLFIDSIVDQGEEVVAPLEVADDRLFEHRLAGEGPIEIGESGDMVARPLL